MNVDCVGSGMDFVFLIKVFLRDFPKNEKNKSQGQRESASSQRITVVIPKINRIAKFEEIAVFAQNLNFFLGIGCLGKSNC